MSNYSTSKLNTKKILQKDSTRNENMTGHANVWTASVALLGFIEISTYPSCDLDLLFSLGTKQFFDDLLVSCHDSEVQWDGSTLELEKKFCFVLKTHIPIASLATSACVQVEFEKSSD